MMLCFVKIISYFLFGCETRRKANLVHQWVFVNGVEEKEYSVQTSVSCSVYTTCLNHMTVH